MIAISWNYQGVGSALTVRVLKGLCRKYDPDFVFLMETKNKDKKMESIRRKVGMEEGVYVEPKGVGGGLTLWWKKEMIVNVMESNKNLINTVVMGDGDVGMIRIFWIYGAPIFKERKGVWDDIKRKVRGMRGPLVCIGDFNDVAYMMEKEGGRSKERNKIECFQEMMRECDLNEVKFQGQRFTWFGVREGELIKERLDRVLVNVEGMERLPNMQVLNLPAVGSDHSPMVLYTEYKDGVAERRFKFEAKWLETEGCERIISEIWGRRFGGSRINQIMLESSMCRRKLKEWCRRKVSNSAREIEELMKKAGSVQDGSKDCRRPILSRLLCFNF